MGATTQRRRASSPKENQTDALRRSPTMARMLDAMEESVDIGHYGQFMFATVARHFMDEDKIVDLLAQQPGFDEPKARALFEHVEERNYNPPQRERILEHQARGGFQIIPNPQDPDGGNLYRELDFPETVYEDINHYYEERAGVEPGAEARL